MNLEKVSIIIPAHNEEKIIKRCLKSIFHQKNFKKYVGEIIVVDDNSTDRTREILEKLGNKIRVIRNKRNLGIVKSRNKGIRASKYNYVCFLHADCVIPKNWFVELSKYFIDKQVAVMNSRVVLPRTEWKKFNLWNRLFYSKFLITKKTICECKGDIWIKNVLKKLGWFSEDFRVAGEDFDLFCRLKKSGYKLYSSNLIVKHIMGSHNIGFWKYFRKELQYGEARGAILRKHHYLILFNPFAFRLWPDLKLIIALPLVVVLRTLAHFIGFWKGFITGKQTL